MDSKGIIKMIKTILENKPYAYPIDEWDNGAWGRVFEEIKNLENK